MMFLTTQMYHNKKFLIFLFVSSFLLRALLFTNFTCHDTNAWIYVDSEQYNSIALNIVQGNGICMEQGSPQYYRLPGYPLFLAACYKVFAFLYGLDPRSKAGMTMALWVQIVLASFIPMLIFLLSLALFPQQLLLAKLAGIVSGLHLGFVLYAGMIATETLSVLLLLLFFLLFLYGMRSYSLVSFETAKSLPPQDERHKVSARGEEMRSIVSNHSSAGVCRYFFLAGLILGLASLIRPIGHYVLIISLVILALPFLGIRLSNSCARGEPVEPFVRTYPSTSPGRARERYLLPFGQQSFMLVLGWLIVVTPWLIRNFLLTGYIFFHSLPGLHFVQYTAANIVMQQERISYPQARAVVLQEWNKLIANKQSEQERPLNEYERCLLGEQLTATYVKKYPGYALKHMSIEIFKTCAGLYSAIILLADGAAWPDYGPNVTAWQKVQRFLFPAVKRPFLAVLIYSEIIMMLLMMIGFGLFLVCCWYDYVARHVLYVIMPYAALFIGLTLAYGGARLRMPADPFLIIAACYGWIGAIQYLFRKELT